MIRCNNCMTEFDSEEDLEMVIDKFDNQKVLGCPICNTDSYLMDIEESE